MLHEGYREPKEMEEEYDRKIEIAHSKSQFKHIRGLPWGDPGSYVKASTPEELARVAHEREVHQDRKKEKEEEQRREQQAREFLIRESERVQKARDEREMRQRAKQGEPQSESVLGTPAPVIVIRPPSKEAESEVCKCGYPGCLGHEVIDNDAIFPGFTSEAALARSPHEIVRFLVEVVGVAGNPSDGELPASALRAVRKPRQ